MATPPSAKRRRIAGGIITINVGPAPVETLTVHESLLRDRGGFFEAALKKQWREGKERKIDLPDDEPDVVAAYIEWIYSGKIEPTSTAAPTELTLAEMSAAHHLLAKIYIFGEKIADNKLCNDTISAWTVLLLRKRDNGTSMIPGPKALRIIYDGTPVGSPLRRFVVHLYSSKPRSWFTPESSYHQKYMDTPEFLLELVHEFAPKTGEPRPDLTLVAGDWFKPTTEATLP